MIPVQASTPNISYNSNNIPLSNNTGNTISSHQVFCNGSATFLVDSGCQVNLIKREGVLKHILIDNSIFCDLSGIEIGSVPTQGEVIIPIQNVNNKFQIISDSFPNIFKIGDVEIPLERTSSVIVPPRSKVLVTVPIKESLTIPEVELEDFEIKNPAPRSARTGNPNLGNAQADASRLSELIKALDLNHLNDIEKASILEILNKFPFQFHLSTDKLGSIRSVSHTINTTDEIPIKTKQYRFPQIHKAEIQKQVNSLLENKIIQESDSPYNSPVWIVPKKSDASGEKRWRMVIDYRKLNEKTVNDAYPLPNIMDILDQLGGSQYFSTLDLASGFHQIPVDKNSKRCMDLVLSGLQGVDLFVYMDDIVIYADSLNDHSRKLTTLFSRLQNAGLTLQPDMAKIAKSLTHLLKKDAPFIWSEKEHVAFETLRDIISSEPLLQFPNFSQPFLVTTDASNFALGAVLSQGLIGSDLPVSYASRTLSQSSSSCLRLKRPQRVIIDGNDSSVVDLYNSDDEEYFTAEEDEIDSSGRSSNRDKHRKSCFDSGVCWLTVTSPEPSLQAPLGVRVPMVQGDLALSDRLVNGVSVMRPPLSIDNLESATVSVGQVAIPGLANDIAKETGKSLDFITNEIVDVADMPEFSADQCAWTSIRIPQNQIIDKSEINNNIKVMAIDAITRNSITNHPAKPTFQYSKDYLYMRQDNLIHFFTLDYEIVSSISKELLKRNKIPIDLMQQHNFDVGDTMVFPGTKYSIFHLFFKSSHNAKPLLKDIVSCFITLKQLMDAVGITMFSISQNENNLESIKWESLQILLGKIFISSKYIITICTGEIIIPSDSRRLEIMKEYHESLVGGHQGITKLYKRIRLDFYWPQMGKEIADFIRTCHFCQRNKILSAKTKQPMRITDTPKRAFDKIQMDIVGPLPISKHGNKYLLTLQDNLTKYSDAIPLATIDSFSIATAFAQNFISRFGYPRSIHTDQGRNFISQVMKIFCKIFKIQRITSTAFHPQSLGSLERAHRVFIDYLKHYCSNTDWDDWIRFAIFSYNTSVYEATGFSPHELIFGVKASIPSGMQKEEVPRTFCDYFDELFSRITNIQTTAAQHLFQR